MNPATAAPTEIPGLFVLEMKHVPDHRGAIREFFRASDWERLGLPAVGEWRQLNVTTTTRGVIRGLHGEQMTKLVGVVAGEAFGAYVDVRPGSPTLGTVVTVELRLGRQVLVPAGVCNGFQTTSDESVYVYCFDAEWAPDMAGAAIDPLDAHLSIPWPIPIDDPLTQLSEKDRSLPAWKAP